MTATEPIEHVAASGAFRMPRWITVTIAINAVAYVALLVATYVLTGEAGAVALLLFAGAVTAIVGFTRTNTAGRAAALVFGGAFLIRSFAALAFHRAAMATLDPFRGSPDAWNYYSWAAKLAGDFHHGWFPGITAYYQTGRWDVGYYYVLGFFYSIFGTSLLVGRLVGAIFGSLAVLMVLLIARRLVPERAAIIGASAYALLPMSIGWSTDTVLRDAFVWFLLLAGTWLAIRFFDRPRFPEWLALFGVIAALRYTRGYTAYFFDAGLGVVLALAILNRGLRPRIARRAAPIVALFLLMELFFISFGFPDMVQSVRGYDVARWIEKPMPTKLVHLPSLPAGSGGPAAGSAEGAVSPIPLPPRPDASLPDGLSTPQRTGLAANAVRLVLSPFGWTFYLPGHSVWPVYSVWPWYFLLPAAGVGAVVILRRGSILTRSLVIVTGMYLGALALVGKGDAIRQRETAAPFIILIALAGVLALRHRRRVLVPAYAAWLLLLTVGMAYHIHSLRGRRFSPEGIELPAVSSSSQSLSRAPDNPQ